MYTFKILDPAGELAPMTGVGELSIITALVILVLWRPKVYPILIPWKGPYDDTEYRDDYLDQLIGWERDRVLSMAKGIAGAAAGYLLALLPVVLKHQISVQVSSFMVIGTLVGALGLFILACDMSAATSEFTTRPMKSLS
jgi:hypothetical protein